VSTTYLLDANVLIALVLADHEHHGRAEAWAATVDQISLCPIVEGALVRYLVRSGEGHAAATAILSALYTSSRCAFWADAVSYASTPLDHVIGHRQVTDAYLASLAVSRGGRLATFDRGLAQALPAAVELIS
jgi:toxin-antitoxin system PIN domain toxin